MGALLIVICGVAYYFFMPVAEVATVRRGTAISAVYGTVRIEPAFVVHVRAQNSGFIQLAEEFSAGRGAIGKSVTKGQLLASIADETTARQLKQAQADLKAATERAKLPLPASARTSGRIRECARSRVRKSKKRGEPIARRA